MKLSRFTAPTDFQQRAEPFLVAREAEHNLMLGIITSLVNSPRLYTEPPYLALVEDDAGAVIAIALRTPPFNAVLSLILDETRRDHAIALLADNLRRAYGQLPGVTADSAIARAFAEEWRRVTGEPYRVVMAERIYQLDTVIPVGGVPGALREVSSEDRDLLIAWLDAFQREAIPGVITPPEQMVDQLFAASARRMFLWVDGEPVAMAGTGGQTPHGARIGPVYTPPSLRGLGYASACTAALSQLILDEGRRFCFLYTDLSNPTSNKIYQAIGYRPVSDADMVTFGAE
ncbi:MAG: GNAT family N-acetyltransferase [Ktedonobacterales bacterium]